MNLLVSKMRGGSKMCHYKNLFFLSFVLLLFNHYEAYPDNKQVQISNEFCHLPLLSLSGQLDTSWIPEDILTAIDNDDVNAILKIRRAGRDLTIRSGSNGQTLLHYAAFKGKSEALFTLSSFIDTDSRDEQGRSPLHYAVLNVDHASRIETLYVLIVDLEIDIDAVDQYGYVASAYYHVHEGEPSTRLNLPDEQQRTLAQLSIEIGKDEASRQSHIDNKLVSRWERNYRKNQGLFPFHNNFDAPITIKRIQTDRDGNTRLMYTPEFKERIFQELNSGKTIHDLASKYGLTPGSISTIRKERSIANQDSETDEGLETVEDLD